MTHIKYLLSFACLFSSLSANAVPILTFLIDGDTFSEGFSIENDSDDGEFVTRFQLDITPTGTCFDTVDGGPDGAPCATFGEVPFTPTGGTAATTGLVGPVTIADGTSILDILFNDFAPTEVFSWDIDVDFVDPNLGFTVFGNDLIGASAFVDFSDGQRLTGVLAEVDGNSDASAFTVTGIAPTPSDVPAPAPIALLGLGLAGLGISRRRK